MNLLMNCLLLDFRSSKNRIYEVVSIIACSACLSLIILVFLSLRAGLLEVIKTAGAETLVVVLANGAESEIISSFSILEVNTLKTRVKSEFGSDIQVSPELFTNIRASNRDSDQAQIVAVRGVGTVGVGLRQNFSIRDGQMFQPGRRELIVGKELASRYSWLQLNKKITLGSVEWTIVGVFEADETVVESEVWGDVSLLQDAYNRRGVYQSIRLGLNEISTAKEVVKALNENAETTNILARTQREYYATQINEMMSFVDIIAIPSITILMLATGLSALQSMHTMIEARQIETAVLRAIGYPLLSLSASMFSFAIFLSVIGAIIGILITFGIFSQAKTVIHNHSSLSEIIFPFSMSLGGAGIAFSASVVIALIGGMPPAFLTLRRSIVNSIRKW